MTDVKALTDVELTELWLSEVKNYAKTPEATGLVKAIDHEMRERGAERMRNAWHIVSAMRADPNYAKKAEARVEMRHVMEGVLRRAGLLEDGEEVTP